MFDEPNAAQQPQAWTCVKCGAALPVEAGTGALVTCGYCGTPFRLPTAQPRGGVNISGGSVVIGGDLIGRDRITVAASAVTQPTETIWDEVDGPDDKGVSIEAKDLQVSGDVIGGSVVKTEKELGWWDRLRRLFSN